MKKQLSFMMLMLIAVAVILSACSSSEKGASEAVNSDVNGKESTKREISHVLGTTTIEGKPERIVTLYQGATDTLLQFGVKPVGVVESWAQQPMYDYLKDDLQDVTYVGLETQPNLEEISALKPDLIIATQVRHEEIYSQLSQIAPTVVSTILYDIHETTSLIGQAIGEEEKATALIEDWEARVSDFNTKISKTEGWPISASVINFREDHARIYVKGFAGSILSELGFKGPKDLKGDDLEIVRLTDKESIPNMNADVSFLFYEDNEAVNKTFEEWSSHPLYQNLDSVKTKQEFRVDEVIWNFAGGLKSAHLMLDDLYKHFDIQ